MENIIQSISQNKFFYAFIVFFMNIGGRYIGTEIPSSADILLNKPMFKAVFVFSLAYVSTRDIGQALFITGLFILLFKFLLNEKSRMFVLDINSSSNDNNLKKKQYEMAKKIVVEYEKQSNNSSKSSKSN